VKGLLSDPFATRLASAFPASMPELLRKMATAWGNFAHKDRKFKLPNFPWIPDSRLSNFRQMVIMSTLPLDLSDFSESAPS